MRKVFIIFLLVIASCFLVNSRNVFAQEKTVQSQPEEGLKARCSSDADCSRPGMIGFCQAAGQKEARCAWQEIIKVPATVVEPETCRSCQTGVVVEQLRSLFPGLEVEYLKAGDERAKNIISEFKIKMLPAYILSKDVEREPGFATFKPMATFANGKYYLNPENSGVSYFLGREARKSELDVFCAVTVPGMYQAVKIAGEIAADKKENIAVRVHFIGIEDEKSKKIISPGQGQEGAEEALYACVEKYYPEKAFDYLASRILNASDIWLEDYLDSKKFDVKKLKACARSSEGEALFKEKVRLSQELGVRYVPLFLMNNREIFGLSEKTTAVEIIELMKSNQKAK